MLTFDMDQEELTVCVCVCARAHLCSYVFVDIDAFTYIFSHVWESVSVSGLGKCVCADSCESAWHPCTQVCFEEAVSVPVP